MADTTTPPDDTKLSKPFAVVLAFFIGGFTWGLGSVLIKAAGVYGHERSLRALKKKHEALQRQTEEELISHETEMKKLKAQREAVNKQATQIQAMAGFRRRLRKYA